MESRHRLTNLSSEPSSLHLFDLSALGLGLPLLLCWMIFAPLSGYPTNDDPLYGRSAQIFADEGRFQVVTQAGELAASSAAHAIIGGAISSLFGFSYRVLFLAVILQLWLAAIAVYFLVRETGGSRWFALWWGSVFLANPLSLAQAFTFMTDAPAMSWGMYAIYFFRRGVFSNAPSLPSITCLLIGSACIGVAFWMRQTHVLLCVMPTATFLLLWFRGSLSLKRCCWGIFAAVSPAAVAVFLFETGLLVFGNGVTGQHGRIHVVAPAGINWYQNAINVYGLGILIGFLCLPMLPVLLDQSRTSWRSHSQGTIQWGRLGVGTIVALIWLIPLVLSQGRACLTSATGNVLSNAHYGPIFLSDFEMPERWGDMGGVTWPNWVWGSLTLLGIFNISVLATCLIPLTLTWRRDVTSHDTERSTVFWGLVAASIPIMAVTLSVRTGVQDRYWMLILPIVFAMVPYVLSQQTRSSAGMLATGLLVLQFALSVVFARDFLTWNQLRWRQVESWLSQGLAPEEIDGGRDINAWYRSGEDYTTMPRPGDTSTWWSGRAHVALSIGPRDGWIETGRLKWRAWATARDHEILLLKKE